MANYYIELKADENNSRSIKKLTGKVYDTARKVCDGYIERVTLGEGIDMLLDEEGRCKGKPINKIATMLFRKAYGCNDFIVGDVILCLDGGSEWRGMPKELADRLMTLIEWHYAPLALVTEFPKEAPEPRCEVVDWN